MLNEENETLIHRNGAKQVIFDPFSEEISFARDESFK